MEKSKLASRVLASILAAVLVALVGVFAFSQAPVAQAVEGETSEEKWTNFKTLVESGQNVDLDEDLIAFSPITVDKAVAVTSTNGATIKRQAGNAEGNADFPVFSVASGGDLTLGAGITLSGETESCAPTSTTPPVTTTKETISTNDLPVTGVKIKTSQGFLKADGTYTNDASEAAEWTITSETAGYIISQGSLNTSDGEQLNTDNDFSVLTIQSGSLTVINWQQNGTLEGLGWYPRASDDMGELGYYSGGEYDFEFYKDSTAGTGGTGGGDTGDGPQQCDGKVDCGTYDKDTFTSGTAIDPKGFFVEVDAGGKATLDGATLTKFVTDGSVHHAAPVVVKGGTFDIKDGSITGNSVGYTADNNMFAATAQAIGKEDESGNHTYSGEMGKWDQTETAGGVIYTNNAKGEISGGRVAGNRGDTGGVLVQGSGHDNNMGKMKTGGSVTPGLANVSSVKFIGGDIDNNIGVHHGGGLTVYNGAAVEMNGQNAKITNNFSWHKGGGVFVSEEQFGSFQALKWYPGTSAHTVVGEAAFTLNDGLIDGNHAVHRGGGIEVASNHVVLNGGTISNNNSRTLGGGIYVEGDEGRMYQLWVTQGCISGNEAVDVAGEGGKALGPNDTSAGCGFSNNLVPVNGSDVTFQYGFWGEEGDGGGLWLCPLGGNSTFVVDANNSVIVAGNKKAGSGKDVFITYPSDGAGNGVNVIDFGSNDFLIEGTQTKLQKNVTYSGQLALENTLQGCSGGVDIKNNSAVNGGGIAANGTVLFGQAHDTYRAAAGLTITKSWGSERTEGDVILKLSAKVGDQVVPLSEVPLDGAVDSAVNENGDVDETLTAYESGEYVATVGLPLTVVLPDGSVAPLFTVDIDGTGYDPSKVSDLEAIYKAGNAGTLKTEAWNLVIEETDAEGNVQTYVLPAEKAKLESITAQTEEGQPVTYKDQDGNDIVTVGTYTTKFAFSDEIINDNEPTIEKYVAKNVHKEVAIGEEYDYDILVYVPLDADSIRIKDELKGEIELVSTKADIEGSVVVKKTNDHTVGGTVADETAVNSEAKVTAEAKIDGQNIEIEIADATPARGQYIQVSFKAKLTADGTHETVENDGTVQGGETPHDGVPNDATYQVKVGDNDWSSDYDSNTVTVKPKPEEPAIEKYVNKNVHKDIEIDEEFTYDVLAYITKDADEATITDTLVDILEFATEASAVTVVDLGEEVDHTPNGSVAKDGTPVTGAVPAISGQTLTVQIADATALRGHWVKVTFDAKIKAGTKASDLAKAYKTIDKNDPVITNEEHIGIPNTASYEIRVKNASGVAEKKYEKPSNTVTVKPNVEVPELEKYIAQDVHLADVADGEAFTYDIVAYVVKDADEIEITDVLNDNLDFVSAEGDVKVADLGTTNNHNTNGAFTGEDADATVASAGTDITSDANVAIAGKTLTVGIADIASKDLRGHFVRVTFQATIAQDAGYELVEDNGTVNSDKSHEGIPNKASYRTKVGNDWNSDYDLDSNVVTVTPKKPDAPTPSDNPQPDETLSAEASTVTKTWADGGNTKDRDDVEFQLYRKVGDGAWELVQGKTVTLTSEDSDGLTTWTGHFDNLPAYENGEKISYRAVEANSADFEGLYTPDADEDIIIVDADSTSGMGATNHPFTPNTAIEVSKQKVGGGDELAGAKLTVLKLEEQDKYSAVESWETGNEAHAVQGLEPGVYKLQEDSAPQGYAIASPIDFRVNVDGTVECLQNGQWVAAANGRIVMFDAPADEPSKPGNPGTPVTNKAPVKPSAKTADAVGGATVALLLAAVLGAGGVAYAGSRSRTSRKK